MIDMRAVDLNKLNSATKYPSIPTYHKINLKNGVLSEEHIKLEGEIIITEKIDGANGRIISFPNGDYLIGSREELLYAKGDLIENNVHGIVSTLKPIAENIQPNIYITVYFFEVFGVKELPNSKNYTGYYISDANLFDVIDIYNYEILYESRERIASWRDSGGQYFVNYGVLLMLSRKNALRMVPYIRTMDAKDFPTTIEETYEFLKINLPKSKAILDIKAKGIPEGIVVKSQQGQRTIVKIRNQNYNRTMTYNRTEELDNKKSGK